HERGTRRRRGRELLVRLVVPVHDDPLAGDPRAHRERELPAGRDVRAQTLLREQPQQAYAGERLHAVEDERSGGRLHIGARQLAERLLAVDDEGGSELIGKPRRTQAADQKLAALARRSRREQVEDAAHPGRRTVASCRSGPNSISRMTSTLALALATFGSDAAPAYVAQEGERGSGRGDFPRPLTREAFCYPR